jgi:hypothetical protein
MSDDGWSDEEKPVRKAPEIIDTCVVVREYIPESNDYLTLEEDNLVYVFSKDPKVTGKEGFWLGETKFVVGIFPKASQRVLFLFSQVSQRNT